MKGDFSRDTFRARRHYTGVLMQQGHIVLDADWNEQVAILLHYQRSVVADIIGWHGTPHPESSAPGADGFGIDLVDGDLRIGPGHYYVDGILCENDEWCSYPTQPGAPVPEDVAGIEARGTRLAFLDVWERHITALEDPALLEPALGGSDTCTRRQLVWQVRVLPVSDKDDVFRSQDALAQALGLRRSDQAASLRARTAPTRGPHTEVSVAGYTGLENRLYRVEIQDASGTPLFKWSRSNASEASAISNCNGNVVEVHLTTEGDIVWTKGDWVELVDDDIVLSQRSGDLVQVTDVSQSPDRLVLSDAASVNPNCHPIVRRWDGTGPVEEGRRIELEAGIEISFGSGILSDGDYWLIPARSATGSIEWPTDGNTPRWVRPRGIRHHYAPLALLDKSTTDLRRFFSPLAG
jgi:hypothetical protein